MNINKIKKKKYNHRFNRYTYYVITNSTYIPQWLFVDCVDILCQTDFFRLPLVCLTLTCKLFALSTIWRMFAWYGNTPHKKNNNECKEPKRKGKMKRREKYLKKKHRTPVWFFLWKWSIWILFQLFFAHFEPLNLSAYN